MSDLISREAVENITWEEPSYSDPLNVLTEVRDKVRELPSADIIDHARAIKEYCKERMKKPIWCNDCPLYEKACFLFGNVPTPCKWDLPEGRNE